MRTKNRNETLYLHFLHVFLFLKQISRLYATAIFLVKRANNVERIQHLEQLIHALKTLVREPASSARERDLN